MWHIPCVMEIELDLTKGVYENAADYYERSKKGKRKLIGLQEAIDKTKAEMAKESARIEEEQARKVTKRREREWFEKFHWTLTKDGLMVVAGKDAQTNTIIVRKHLNKGDKYLHADVTGAPSTVVVSEGKGIPRSSLEEAAGLAASYSRAFSTSRAAANVYAVDPDQVKSAAKAGEFLAKGSFVILGERDWFRNTPLRVLVSWDGTRPIALFRDGKGVAVVPGDTPKGELAKKVKHKLDQMFECDVELDDVMAVLPPGSGDLE